MAGFEVIIYGRFWVIAEGESNNFGRYHDIVADLVPLHP
jgi:hypothetical protein